MTYLERLSAPVKTNKYYIQQSKGGYNPCIQGNTNIISLPFAGAVIPNCVGYAVGRFNEIGKKRNCNYLGNANAENFSRFVTKQNLEFGSKPELGACIVWQGGATQLSSDGCGHVAIVEEVKSDTEILVSESGWSSKKPFWTATHKLGKGEWIEGDDYSWMKNGNYTFLGFIYNPYVRTITNPYTKPYIDNTSDKVFVEWVQWQLRYKFGYDIEVDGIYGKGTTEAIKKFQKTKKVDQTGNADIATLYYLSKNG